MIHPTVACVMLANGRPEMVVRAIKSMKSQSYMRAFLHIHHNDGDRSIGALRNAANDETASDIICHWDSDDWNHPLRIQDQVDLLISSGAACVGYRSILFWADACPSCSTQKQTAWRYEACLPQYATGTSMCYWRKTWEAKPFKDISAGCDDLYWLHEKVDIKDSPGVRCNAKGQHWSMMIASIHGANTCAAVGMNNREWQRAFHFDEYCRKRMKL